MTTRVFLIGYMMIFFIGCWTLAPDYNRPNPPVPEEWPQGDAYRTPETMSTAPTVPELSRQEFFPDERLQKVIKIALANSRDLRLAALNVERARALYGIQRAELFPVLDAGGTGDKQRRSSDLINPGDPKISERYDVNLGVASWEIDFFGRIRSLKDQALEEYLATEQARRSTEITLVSEIARTYLNLAADRASLNLSQSTLENYATSYRLIQRRYDVGLATELDLRQAQTPMEAARRNVAIFTQQTAQDHNALNLLAGTPIPEELLPADLADVTPPQDVSPGLSSEVLLNRPDIVAAEERLKGAYAFIGAARAAFFPRISLTTGIGTASDQLSGLFEAGTDTWRFSPNITMPIFDARTWSALRVSESDRDIALTQYEKTIQTAFKEVADALAVQGTIDEQVAAQQALVEAIAETYRLANKRYAMGIDSYLGVLDAQRSLFASQEILITVQLIKLSNQVRLYAVLGG